MSCGYYNYYSCGKSCPRLVKTTAIEYEDDVVILTIPAMKIKNHDKICLCIAQALPEEITPDTQVVIYVGDSSVKFATATRLGNLLYADALKSRKIYPMYAATDTEAFLLQDINKLGPTDHQFPIIPPADPAKKS